MGRQAATEIASALRWARVAFTGKLASGSHPDAFEIVRQADGEPCKNVTRLTRFLVIGMRGWPLLSDGSISNKLRRAERLNRQGCRIQIISEQMFLEFAGLRERQAELQKTIPAPDVCEMLEIQSETLVRWEQFGLIRSNQDLYDFQDVVSLQTILGLVRRDVRVETIAHSIHGLAKVLPGTERPLAQLKIVDASHAKLYAQRDDMLLAPDGQFAFDYDEKSSNATEPIAVSLDTQPAAEWFELGQTCEDEERYDEAAEAYRKAIDRQPNFPSAIFNLGNVQRATGHIDDALSNYRAALAFDPSMSSAWYNLADVQEECGKINESIQSLEQAISVSPEFADAHFNLAICLEKVGRKAEADRQWAHYLALDRDSEWAMTARARLASPTDG